VTSPKDDRVADYLAGTMTARERATFEQEVLASDELAEEIYAEKSLDEAIGRAVAARARHAETKIVPLKARGPSWWKVALPLAAAIALVAIPLVQRERTQSPGPVFRGADSAFTIVAPTGPVASLDRFTWNGDPGAASYELTVRDAAARIVWRMTTTETSVEPPSGAIPGDLSGGTWTVRAIDASGIPLGARSAEFTREP
jgi:hypothetical protein